MFATLLPLVLSLIPSLVHGIEAFITGARQGKIKKDTAMNIVSSITGAVNSVLPGTLSDTETALITTSAAKTIDAFVSVANDLHIFKHTLIEEETTPTGVMSTR
jgi:hypothetical protein